MKYFKLPDLGEGLPEAEIIQWHIKEGDYVKTDQVVVSVETAKAIIEVPSPQHGVIAHLFGKAGDSIHTGEPLIEFANEEQSDSGTVVGEIASTQEPSDNDDFFIGAAPSSQKFTTPCATPAVKSLANRLGVDITQLTGSGAQGNITPQDIEKAATFNNEHGPATPLKGVRKQMAKAMVKSHQHVVPVTLFEDVDIHHWPIDCDITLKIINAISAACKAVPILNSWFDGDNLSLRTHESIQLGVAVDTPQGLFVPVLRDIDQRSSANIRQGLDQLRTDVEARTIPAKELQGATITLSNFGTLCGRYATPIVMPPQVAIIGTGSIRSQPVAYQEQIALHRVIPLSLTFDHRVATGAEAARFMKALITSLES